MVADIEGPKSPDAVVEHPDIGIVLVEFRGIERERIGAGLDVQREPELEHDLLALGERGEREPELGGPRGEDQVAHAVMELDPDRGPEDGRVGL